MGNTSKTAFVGFRIPHEAKAKLDAEAERQGLSMTDYCKKLLASGVNGGDGDDAGNVARPAGPSTVDDQEAVVTDLTRLINMRTDLKRMCEEHGGIFNSIPVSLRTALRSVEGRIESLTQKLKSMLPASQKRKSGAEKIVEMLFPDLYGD